MPDRILVVDDEPAMRRSLAIMLRREGYVVGEAPDGGTAVDHLGRDPVDLVIADLRMNGVSGLDVLRHVKQTHPDVEVILMTAYGTIEAAVDAMRLGAYDFVTKPFEMEQVLLRVRNALERRRLKSEVHRLRAEASNAFTLEAIVGTSEAIRRILSVIPRAAQADSTVLITGESGTGKELVARAIHGASRRVGGPFVAVSCAALPDQLLENELFGHVKGAFTGAAVARKGLLEEAQEGTFFLDEIGEASPEIQKKLLRVIEERSVRRLGENRPIPLDVRIVTATNRELQDAVEEKSFRGDLFHRLNVLHIHMPPLRARADDIPPLAQHFLTLHSRRLGREFSGFSPAAMAALLSYGFPGNVRELSGVIERAVVLGAGPVVEREDLSPRLASPPPAGAPPAAGGPPPTPAGRPKTLVDLERDAILERIDARGGDLHLVAEDLGISRTTLWRRMKEYGIEIRRQGFTR
jgi:two-component system, NtrC family, response regulator HydG